MILLVFEGFTVSTKLASVKAWYKETDGKAASANGAGRAVHRPTRERQTDKAWACHQAQPG